jgi:hypothetical protein
LKIFFCVEVKSIVFVGGIYRNENDPPRFAKRCFMKSGGVKTTKVNDYKIAYRQDATVSHKIQDHRWYNTECSREQKCRATEWKRREKEN